MNSKTEFVEMIAQSIREGDISINDIVKALIPPKKQKRQSEPKMISEERKKAQKEYFKQWYERNKEEVKLRVKANQALKKALCEKALCEKALCEKALCEKALCEKAPLIATTDLTTS